MTALHSQEAHSNFAAPPLQVWTVVWIHSACSQTAVWGNRDIKYMRVEHKNIKIFLPKFILQLVHNLIRHTLYFLNQKGE